MTFDELRAAGYKNPTVAIFYGLQCTPCERLKPKLRAVCEELGVRLEEFNSNNEMAAIRALSLRSVPSVVVVHGNDVRLAFFGDADTAEIKIRLFAVGVKVA